MFIQTEQTPNPNTIKFLPGHVIHKGETVDYRDAEQAGNCPLAQRLFAVSGVTGVFIAGDYVSITKNEMTDWYALKPMVLETLVHYFVTHKLIEIKTATNNVQSKEDSEETAIEKEIKELLESRIRPAVAMDGGDIVFKRFEDGIVYLQMRGACQGCPSASATLKSGIENMLRYYIPEVTEVRAEQEEEAAATA
jgi:Fe-S cluster biogenesis protein NfuA